ncbi:unnamed protein product [Brachionus calyciflorus]|uniref:Mitochondrial calcium uniporter regulator 1 n=1 Tax=Brachionus calyciflorus TaxID=104777 RepID=A0A813PB75_9BILA|nr:unnamed protein product [Brachionus calyciflorus]
MKLTAISTTCLKFTKINTLTNKFSIHNRNLSLYKKSCLNLNNKNLNRNFVRCNQVDSSGPKDDATPSENPTKSVYESLSTKKSLNIIAERSYFDTHLFVSNLMDSGFTQHQAEQLCVLFKEIVNFISQDIKKDCVTKTGQELSIQQVMIHIGSLKKDMIILEKSEFSTLRNENEKLALELKNFRDLLNDEIIKLKGGFTLDINLEKSRSNELLHDASNRLHKLDSRIDTEISNVKALLEAFKADTIRYIAGSLLTVLVIILGALRYFTL